MYIKTYLATLVFLAKLALKPTKVQIVPASYAVLTLAPAPIRQNAQGQALRVS